MKKVKISIIIPLLNSVTYLAECMQSIREQSLQEIQLIFVDAGSTDGSVAFIEAQQKEDERILLLHATKQSYGHQVNLGIKRAEGEYIGIVESDDIVAVDFFATLYEKTRLDKPDFVKGGFTQFATVLNRKVYDKVQRFDSNMERTIDLKKAFDYRFFDLVHIWSGIYRRDFLIEQNILMNPTKGASYQDTSFSLLVAVLADTCLYTSECGYFYRIDNANSSVKSKDKVYCIIDEYDYLIQVLQEKKLYVHPYQEAVEKYRLVSYFWNFRRMNRAGRELFLIQIHEYMQKIKKEAKNLSRSDLEVLKYLADLNGAQLFEKTEEILEVEYQKFLSLLKEKKQYCFVLKERQAKKLYYLQETFQLNFIDKVYNSILEIKKEQKNEFVILGKTITKEVERELQSKKIARNHVDSILYFPSFSWMVEHL